MHIFFIVYGFVLLMSFLTMTVLLLKAPLGWEDDSGFHTKQNISNSSYAKNEQ